MLLSVLTVSDECSYLALDIACRQLYLESFLLVMLISVFHRYNMSFDWLHEFSILLNSKRPHSSVIQCRPTASQWCNVCHYQQKSAVRRFFLFSHIIIIIIIIFDLRKNEGRKNWDIENAGKSSAPGGRPTQSRHVTKRNWTGKNVIIIIIIIIILQQDVNGL